MKRLICLASIVFAACGSDSKNNATDGSNGSGGSDSGGGGGSDSGGNPVTIHISGTVTNDTQNASTPISGATVAAFAHSDPNTPVAMATTGADGTYSLTVTASGALNGFIKATATNEVDTYLYPTGPLSADFTGADAHMLTSDTFNMLTILGQKQGMGIIILEVEDSTGALVTGATVSSTPAGSKVAYTDPQSGFPVGTTGTAADGRAFIFNLPPGDVTVSAMKSGSTFQSHSAGSVADALSTTIITE